ncbi:hypothetical protein MYX84_11250, partial [Acidobacteria bacterium AH-259-O06]|nr:hypothetical protein [Acidobacteria bacterium AH-259-O06]
MIFLTSTGKKSEPFFRKTAPYIERKEIMNMKEMIPCLAVAVLIGISTFAQGKDHRRGAKLPVKHQHFSADLHGHGPAPWAPAHGSRTKYGKIRHRGAHLRFGHHPSYGGHHPQHYH